MLKVGITGGIGSGKTTVCKIFELLHIPVFYADDVAKKLMVNDVELVNQIKAVFGENSYLKNDTLNRKHISNIVFNDKNKLNTLNSLVHPAVFKAMDIWVSKQSSKYVVKEAALLFETGSYKKNDYNILVSCDLELRIKRIAKRDLISEEQIKARFDAQFSEDEKLKLTNFVIKNNETEFLIPQVLKLHQQFLKSQKS
jgi:dephospho-CoA kinase